MSSVDAVTSFFNSGLMQGTIGAVGAYGVTRQVIGEFANDARSGINSLKQIINPQSQYINQNGKPSTGSNLQDAIGTAMNSQLQQTNSAVMSMESQLSELNRNVVSIVNKLETISGSLETLVNLEKGIEQPNYIQKANQENKLEIQKARSMWGRLAIAAWNKVKGVSSAQQTQLQVTREDLLKSIPFLREFADNAKSVDEVINAIKTEKAVFTKETNLAIMKFIPERLTAIGLTLGSIEQTTSMVKSLMPAVTRYLKESTEMAIESKIHFGRAAKYYAGMGQAVEAHIDWVRNTFYEHYKKYEDKKIDLLKDISENTSRIKGISTVNYDRNEKITSPEPKKNEKGEIIQFQSTIVEALKKSSEGITDQLKADIAKSLKLAIPQQFFTDERDRNKNNPAWSDAQIKARQEMIKQQQRLLDNTDTIANSIKAIEVKQENFYKRLLKMPQFITRTINTVLKSTIRFMMIRMLFGVVFSTFMGKEYKPGSGGVFGAFNDMVIKPFQMLGRGIDYIVNFFKGKKNGANGGEETNGEAEKGMFTRSVDYVLEKIEWVVKTVADSPWFQSLKEKVSNFFELAWNNIKKTLWSAFIAILPVISLVRFIPNIKWLTDKFVRRHSNMSKNKTFELLETL